MPNITNGWVYDPDVIDAVCASLPAGIFGDAAPHLKDSGAGKTVLLHRAYEKTGIPFPLLNQGNIGSCTANGIAGAVDCTKAVEIMLGEPTEFIAPTAVEPIYYGARKLSGWRISGDGAVVAHGVKYVVETGTLARIKYDDADLTNYNVDRCRQWGNNKGFPTALESISKEHTIKQFSRVVTWEQCRDSIANNCPVVVGSNYGFSNTTDSKGFAKNNTTWGHCMWICAIRHDRPGALIVNSWGAWNSMKNREFGEPLGSFWVDAETINKMMRSDAWSLSQHEGYPLKVNMEIAW